MPYKNMNTYRAAMVIASGLFFVSCQKEPALTNFDEVILDTSVEKARNVEILYSDSAKVRVRITGPTMLNHYNRRDPRQEFPDGVVIDFFDPEQQPTSRLTARFGVRYQVKGLVVVRDSVVWESVEQNKLETEELFWDERQQKIFTNKFVIVSRPDEIIYGHGFEANQDFSYSKINAIEGKIKVDELSKELE
jgi:LPS export ABC transporter protein LptC